MLSHDVVLIVQAGDEEEAPQSRLRVAGRPQGRGWSPKNLLSFIIQYLTPSKS